MGPDAPPITQIKPTRVAQRVDAHRSRPDGSMACACSTR